PDRAVGGAHCAEAVDDGDELVDTDLAVGVECELAPGASGGTGVPAPLRVAGARVLWVVPVELLARRLLREPDDRTERDRRGACQRVGLLLRLGQGFAPHLVESALAVGQVEAEARLLGPTRRLLDGADDAIADRWQLVERDGDRHDRVGLVGRGSEADIGGSDPNGAELRRDLGPLVVGVPRPRRVVGAAGDDRRPVGWPREGLRVRDGESVGGGASVVRIGVGPNGGVVRRAATSGERLRWGRSRRGTTGGNGAGRVTGGGGRSSPVTGREAGGWDARPALRDLGLGRRGRPARRPGRADGG